MDSVHRVALWFFLLFYFYLVVVYQVEHQVYVSVYRLVLSQLRFHSVQPVNESLESVCKLTGEQQGLLELVLSGVQNKSLAVNVDLRLVADEGEMQRDGSVPFN